MLKKLIEKYLYLLLIIIAVSVFIYWLQHDPVKGFSMSVPGLDNRPEINLFRSNGS